MRRSALVIATVALAAGGASVAASSPAAALNPSATHVKLLPRNQTVGNPQVLQATIGGRPMPTGQVQFFADSAPIGSPVQVVSRKATLTETFGRGAHSVSAQYLGDANLAASTSAPESFVVGDPSDIIAQTLYHSLPKAPVTSWTPTTHVVFVTNLAIVAGQTNYGARTGTATVLLDGTPSIVNVDKSRVVFDVPGGLGPGTHTVQVTYHGDIHYNPDTAGTRHITITQP